MSDGKEYIHDGYLPKGEWKPGKLIRIPDANAAHIKALQLHAKAMAAHCECMMLNSHNFAEVCKNGNEFYTDDAYLSVMRKWGLINEKGEPLI